MEFSECGKCGDGGRRVNALSRVEAGNEVKQWSKRDSGGKGVNT